MQMRQREKWIDVVKCIAMTIVMINHSQWELPIIKFYGGMFFVPVFFILSGYTHKLREESFLVFVKKKAKRLLLPYITANGILFVFFFFKDVVLASKSAGTMGTALLGIFYARNQLCVTLTETLFSCGKGENTYFYTLLNSPTWFLPALFLTMVIWELIAAHCKNDKKKMLLIMLILLCVANLYHYLSPILLPWSVDTVPYFLLMFYWGNFMKEKNALAYLDQKKRIIVTMFLLFLLTAYMNGSVNYSIGGCGKSAMLALYNSLASSTIVMYICYKTQRFIVPGALAVGKQTMILLSYHLLVFSVIQTILPRLWPGVMVFVTLVVLTVVGMGKERLCHGKK